MRFFALALLIVGLTVHAAQAAETGPFNRPALGYAYNALEPAIDAQTMETHYSRHHQAYIDKLNAEVAGNDKLKGKSLDGILAHVSAYNTATRDNAGGHWNHSFFWKVMAPQGRRGEPSPALAQAITDAFGSMEAFRTAFEKAGTERFGSGWAWLIVGADGKLAVTSTPNQDNPLMDVADVKGTPILGNDVWEHAYYLKYQNKRADYLKAWWDVVNWNQVSENYARARAK